MAAPYSHSRRSSSISTMPVYTEMDSTSVYKVITLGNAGIGKSTLMASYTLGTRQQDLTQQSSVGTRMIKRKQKLIQLQLWDTAGQERYDSITSNYYRGAVGCLLCFDITNEQSYSDLITWYERLKFNCDPPPPTILVGLKADQRQSNRYIQTIIKPSDCQLAARNLGLTYKEISCHKQDTIEDVFNMLIDMIEHMERSHADEPEINNNIFIVPRKHPEQSQKWVLKCSSC